MMSVMSFIALVTVQLTGLVHEIYKHTGDFVIEHLVKTDFNVWDAINQLFTKDLSALTLSWMAHIGWLATFIIGLLLFVKGRDIFRLFMGVMGLVTGFGIWRLILSLVPIGGLLKWIVGLLILVGFILLFVSLFKTCIIIAGFVGAATLVYKFLDEPILKPVPSLVVLLVAGVIGALLAAFLTKWFIVIATSLAGSWMMLNAVFTFGLSLLDKKPIYDYGSSRTVDYLIPVLILTAIGIFMDARSMRRKQTV